MAVQHHSVLSATPLPRRAGQKTHRGLLGRLENISISRQFAILSVLSIVLVVACLGYTLIQIRGEMMAQKRSQIQNIVEAADAVARGYVAKAKAGQITEDAAKKTVLDSVGAMRFAGKNYVFVSTFEGTTIAHPNPDLVGKNMIDSQDANGKYFSRDISAAAKAGSGFVDYYWPKIGEKEPSPKVSFVIGVPEWSWSIGAGMWVDDVDAAFWGVVRGLAEILIPVVALLLALVLISSRKVSRLLSTSVENMNKIAAGDLSVEVAGLDRGDEIGSIARAVQVFKDNASELVQANHQRAGLETEAVAARRREEESVRSRAEALGFFMKSFGDALHRLSAGEFDFRLNEAFSPDYELLRQDLNASLEKLQTLLLAISSITGGIQASTQRISSDSDDMSRRTEQQAASLEETAAALDQVTSTVKKTTDGARQARTVVSEARGDAEKSGDIVRRAVEAMGRIEKSSAEIGQIIGVIDEIAFQTNLLALNAGVEAARAGDAGRGFAVVASEVRALAQRSADAAKEIKGLITTSKTEVETGVKLVAETGESLARIVGKVSQINSVVADIAAGAEEQSTALQQVNIAVNQMDQATQQNAAMAEEATAAARSMMQETEKLSEMVDQFQLGRNSSPGSMRRELKKTAPHAFAPAAKAPPRPSASAAPAKPRAVRSSPKVAVNAPAIGGNDEGWNEF